jgi:hypothetical protein
MRVEARPQGPGPPPLASVRAAVIDSAVLPSQRRDAVPLGHPSSALVALLPKPQAAGLTPDALKGRSRGSSVSSRLRGDSGSPRFRSRSD